MSHPRFWTDDELNLLLQMWPTHTCPEIQAALPNRSRGSIYEMRKRLGLQKDSEWNRLRRERETATLIQQGKRHRFRKGQVPANKGQKGITGVHPNTRRNWFQKGRPNGHERRIGAERINQDGYLQRKVTDRKDVPGRVNWKFVHRIVWEETHGPVPDGHIVVFRNGDKSDIRIENLQLISRVELMSRNTVHKYPQPVIDAAYAASRLTRTINVIKGKKQRGTEKQPG